MALKCPNSEFCKVFFSILYNCTRFYIKIVTICHHKNEALFPLTQLVV